MPLLRYRKDLHKSMNFYLVGALEQKLGGLTSGSSLPSHTILYLHQNCNEKHEKIAQKIVLLNGKFNLDPRKIKNKRTDHQHLQSLQEACILLNFSLLG